MPITLGFSRRRKFIGGRAMSEGTRGARTIRLHGQGAPLYGVATSVPSSVSALDSVFVLGKIVGLAFVSSNSEYISFVKNLE
jgi:hypothetical protein